MAPRSRLFLLGRAFARLAAQKRCVRPAVPVKEKIDKETVCFESIVEKRLNEQNTKIARLKTCKDLMEQRLDTELKKYKMSDETQALRIRHEGHSVLLKYIKHGMAALSVVTGILAAKMYNRCA